MHLGSFLKGAVWICALLCKIGKVSPTRHQIYWNSSNPSLSRGDYTLQVHINDYVDVLCPHYPPRRPAPVDPVTETETETFVLYMVGAESYGRCGLEAEQGQKKGEQGQKKGEEGQKKGEEEGEMKAVRRWDCSRPFAPHSPVRFSEKIQRFTPFSLGYEFLPGHDYFYLSLPPPKDQKCLRLRVSVCCSPTLPPAPETAVGRGERDRVQQDASTAKGGGISSQLSSGPLLYGLGLFCASLLSRF